MAISIITSFDSNSRELLDARSGPYDNTTDALNALDTNKRSVGLKVVVIANSTKDSAGNYIAGDVTLYQFNGGISDNDLEEIETGGGVNVVDNLTNTSTTEALSAKQGKVLKDIVDAIDQNRFFGEFTSFANLDAATKPTEAGWRATVNTGGTDIKSYLYDLDDTKWVEAGSVMEASEIKTLLFALNDTNNYSDTEKQKVAAAEAHIANGDVHTTTLEKAKTNAKKFAKYTANEKLVEVAGVDYLRFHNGNAYLYVGAFDEEGNTSFTTTDIFTELTEDPPRWEAMIATFPPVEFAKVVPSSIQPTNTRDIQLNATNLTSYTTVRFTETGSTVTTGKIVVNSYIFINQNTLIVNITSTSSSLEDFDVYVNNGIEVKITNTFSIKNGDVTVPETYGAYFEPKEIGTPIKYSEGGLRIFGSTNADGGYSGFYAPTITAANDFILKFRIVDSFEGQAYEPISGSGFHVAFHPNKTSQSTNTAVLQFKIWGGIKQIDGFTGSNGFDYNDLLEFRRVGTDMLFYKNGVYVSTITGLNTAVDWNSFFYIFKTIYVKDIELTIL